MVRNSLNPEKLAIKATSVAIIGGVVSILLSMILSAIEPVFPFAGGLVSGLIALALVILLAKESKIDDMNFVGVLTLLFAVSLVGSIIATFLPVISPYILSVTDFTLSGLMWTVVYVMIAEAILNKID